MRLSEATIQRRLAEAPRYLPPESPYPFTISDDPPRPAAVLIPLLRKAGAWHLLFIRRTRAPHDRHGGQVAFPGGRCDPGDPDAKAAALREAEEEIGLHPQDVRLLGLLRPMLTITNYRVTPVVGAMPWPYPLRPQPEEVSRIFTIPLTWLADPANRRVELRQPNPLTRPVPVIYFHPYDDEILWGASARMTLLLLEALGLAAPENRYAP